MIHINYGNSSHLVKMGILFPLSLMIIFMVLACSKEIKPTNNSNGNAMEYAQEGFIGNNVYRVVIVEPRCDDSRNMARIKKNAKDRALSSLQKYIISHNMQVNPRIVTDLRVLLERYGNIRLGNKNCETRQVYFYEIKKDRLKEYIHGISRKY